MRIISIVESMSLSQGGPPEVVRNNAKIINEKKMFLSILKLTQFSIFYLLKSFFQKKKKTKLIKFLQKFDIIHFHNLWSFKVIIIAYYARRLGLKYIFISHGYLDEWSMNEKFIKKKLFLIFFLQKAILQCSGFYFFSKEEYEEAKKNINFPDIFIIPNGSDLTTFHIKKNLKYNKKLKKIIFFGRIHKKKGIEILLQALQKLPRSFFESFFSI